MFEALDQLYVAALCKWNAFTSEEKGAVDIVAIVVLIGIAVLLAVVFRDRITTLLGNLFDTIDKSSQKAIK